MKYYCIGIKGTGMSTLAQILYDLGNEVCGYDDAKDYKFTQKGLEDRNIKIYYDHNHDIDKDSIVTYSVAFKEDHPEMKRAKELGLKFKKYCEIMGDVINLFDSIGVSGTHGKTTTSSLVRHIIEQKMPCNYFIGAGDGYATTDNKYFVVESDEFNRHFTYYHPRYSIITNIEEEHMEIYKDIDDLVDTFTIFSNNTKDFIVACGDNKNVRRIKSKTLIKYYGFNKNNDIVIDNVLCDNMGSSFTLYVDGKKLDDFSINLFGEHNILNATAAIYLTYRLGIDIKLIKKALKSFENAKRRFAINNINGYIYIDDYAHHPTEIAATIKAAKQKYPDKRIIAVFMPNTYSRFKDFKDGFVDSLSLADKVFITPVKANREKQEDYPGINSNMIIDKIDNAEEIFEDDVLKLNDYKEDIILFLGCADMSHIINNYKELISK